MFAEYAQEKRVFVPIKAIPIRLRLAFLAAEDKSFYSHNGLSFISIIRASLQNILHYKSGKRPIGASTITQQVARNFLLNSILREVSLSRKIKEAILTFRIESAYTKDHILELYLNEISLGNNSFGVAAAALNYFNKSLEELTIAEMAVLAALPKGPSYYNPKRHPVRMIDRRNWIIDQMLKMNYITPDEAKDAKNEGLTLQSRKASNVVSAGYFADEVRREMITLFGREALYKGGLAVRTTLDPEWQKAADAALQSGLMAYDRNKGWRGPLRNVAELIDSDADKGWLDVFEKPGFPVSKGVPREWRVALVLDVQKAKAVVGFSDGSVGAIHLSHMKWARKFINVNALGARIGAASDVLKKSDVVYVRPYSGAEKKYQNDFELVQAPLVSGGLVVMDPHTGRVRALSGGFTFENSQFNRVTQAKRQAGSALKPFVYLKALESGIMPNAIIDDSPLAIDLGPDQGVYTPKNYTTGKFYGPITLRCALEKSYNLATVRLVYERVKLTGLAEITERFGVYERMPLHYSNILGAEVVTLLKLTTGYAMIVNGGYRIQPTLIIRAQDRRGFSVLNDAQRTLGDDISDLEWNEQTPPMLKDKRKLITNPVNAYQVVSMLEGSVKRGTSRRANIKGINVAGKTGTSNDFNDAWFVGFTPDVVVGIYVGFDGHKTLGKHQGGGYVAAPIFKEFMKRVAGDIKSIPFRIPKDVSFVRINYETGERAKPGDTNVISEVFPSTQLPPELPSRIGDDSESINGISGDESSFSAGGIY